jgi:hypothetical protein
MKDYRVTGGVAKFGAGQLLRLNAAQIRPRAHHLELPKGYNAKAKDAQPAEVKATVPIEFKTGEVVGLPDVPKHLREQLVNLDAPAELPLADTKPASTAPAPQRRR